MVNVPPGITGVFWVVYYNGTITVHYHGKTVVHHGTTLVLLV